MFGCLLTPVVSCFLADVAEEVGAEGARDEGGEKEKTWRKEAFESSEPPDWNSSQLWGSTEVSEANRVARKCDVQRSYSTVETNDLAQVLEKKIQTWLFYVEVRYLKSHSPFRTPFFTVCWIFSLIWGHFLGEVQMIKLGKDILSLNFIFCEHSVEVQ